MTPLTAPGGVELSAEALRVELVRELLLETRVQISEEESGTLCRVHLEAPWSRETVPDLSAAPEDSEASRASRF